MRRVLFIGNSHTYLHDMPGMLEALSGAAGSPHRILTDQVTGEGADLAWHWDNFPTRARIRSAKWDYVVLQDRSGGPLEAPDRLAGNARRLHERIVRQGASTVLYMTWARQDRPETQPQIADVYTRTAEELGALLAPVGLAWQRVLRQRPEFPLFHRDGRHASAQGAYLTACVFYGIFQERSPVGLPRELTLHGKPRVRLSHKDATLLQESAWQVLQGESGR